MLLLFLAGLYAALVPLGFGIWLVKLLRVGLKLTDTAPVPALLEWLGGLALLTVLLEMASLVGPLHTVAHLAAVTVAVTGLGQSVGRRRLRQIVQGTKQWKVLTQVLAGLLALYALFNGAMPCLNAD